MKTIVKIMNAAYVVSQIGLDNPKAGEKIKINGAHYVLIKDKTHGLIAQMDFGYAPHKIHKPGWMFTHKGLILIMVALASFIIYSLANHTFF